MQSTGAAFAGPCRRWAGRTYFHGWPGDGSATTYVLRAGDPLGERLAKQANARGMLLMMCDMCALERNLAVGEPRWCAPDGAGRTEPGHVAVSGTVSGVTVGCFPDLYAALAGNMPDQIITL